MPYKTDINPNITTLCRNTDFRRIYHRGKYKAIGPVVTYITKGRDGIRYGITASKKVGNSPARSRARRVITAAFREILKTSKFPPCDIVFIARPGIETKKSTDIEKLLRRQFADIFPQVYKR
jgi:ribonuclease P protein component, eubacterial